MGSGRLRILLILGSIILILIILGILLFAAYRPVKKPAVNPAVKAGQKEQQGYKPVLSSNITARQTVSTFLDKSKKITKDNIAQKDKSQPKNKQAKNIFDLSDTEIEKMKQEYHSLPQEDKELNLYPTPERLKELKKKKVIIY